jgi:cytolysin (calcineurin-like family phosphatase)
VTDLGEVRAVLATVAEQLGSAYQQAGVARARIADAVAVLDGLGEQHSEPLVPAELRQAAEELERGLGLITGGASVVADIDARL